MDQEGEEWEGGIRSGRMRGKEDLLGKGPDRIKLVFFIVFAPPERPLVSTDSTEDGTQSDISESCSGIWPKSRSGGAIAGMFWRVVACLTSHGTCRTVVPTERTRSSGPCSARVIRLVFAGTRALLSSPGSSGSPFPQPSPCSMSVPVQSFASSLGRTSRDLCVGGCARPGPRGSARQSAQKTPECPPFPTAACVSLCGAEPAVWGAGTGCGGVKMSQAQAVPERRPQSLFFVLLRNRRALDCLREANCRAVAGQPAPVNHHPLAVTGWIGH